jgi:hypothetical protein
MFYMTDYIFQSRDDFIHMIAGLPDLCVILALCLIFERHLSWIARSFLSILCLFECWNASNNTLPCADCIADSIDSRPLCNFCSTRILFIAEVLRF